MTFLVMTAYLLIKQTNGQFQWCV